jgi:hypothetical protein
MTELQPPKALFTCNPADGGEVLRIEVRGCLSSDGHFWSTHHPLTPADAEVQQRWPGGGNRHVAQALLTEAVRREAFVCMLLELQKDPELKARIEKGDPVEGVLKSLSEAVLESLTANLAVLAGPSAREVVEMIRGQLKAQG